MRYLLLIPILMSQLAHADEPKPGDVTDNPQKYVLTHAEFPEDGITQMDCSSCSTMRDALFIASTRECGNAGCGFYIFRRDNGSRYSYLTNVFLSQGGFQFLESSHKGLPDIRNYHHMSADDGDVVTYEFDGKTYRTKGKPQRIKSLDWEKFVKPEKVKFEYFTRDLKKIDR